MKLFKCIIVFAVLTTLTNSCKKQNDFSFKELIGTWQWVRSDGGIATMHLTPASTGKNVDLKLTGDHRYYFITNDTLTSRGIFSIKTEKSIYDHKDRQ